MTHSSNVSTLGTLFIVAAPSGGGKTSLVKKLLENLENMVVSISHTTREIRPGEVNGEDYFFVSESEFQAMVRRGEFVEYAEVFGHYYGTSVLQITERLQAGTDIVLDIDWQGAQQIKASFSNAVSIFVLPPSLEVLKQRLLDRRRDSEQIIMRRMQAAHDEMDHFSEFDYLIVNDDFHKAASELTAIVTAHRLRTAHQLVRQRNLLSFLLSSQ